MIIGNEALTRYFEGVIAGNALSQAYCLAGPDQVGKRTLANWVAGKVLGVNQDQVTKHPDYYYLSLGWDEKNKKPRTEVSVEDARKLRRALELKTLAGEKRVAVIDDANLMSTEAANALLKIVEESPLGTTMFFLTDRVENLPATIISRSEVLTFAVVNESIIAQALIFKGFAKAVAEELSQISYGRPGRAIYFAANPEEKEFVLKTTKVFDSLLTASAGERGKEIENFTEKKDGERVSENVREVLDIWIMTAREKLLKNNLDRRLERIINSMYEGKLMLRENVNARLILENIFLTQ